MFSSAAFLSSKSMPRLGNLSADILKEMARPCVLQNGSKLAFILVENCAAEFLNRRSTEKVNRSRIDFHNGFSPEKVNQDTVAGLFCVCV